MLLLVLGAVSVRAESSEDVRRAKTHYQAGHALYKIGNYSDAIREFLIGYDLAPRPEFLLNIGQTYRKLNDVTRARAMYEKFLREVPRGDSRRATVEQILKELPAAPVEETPTPSPSPTVATTSPIQTTAAVAAPAPPKKSFIRRHWWIIPVSAIVAAGIGVGIYFAVRPSDPCAGGSLACTALP